MGKEDEPIQNPRHVETAISNVKAFNLGDALSDVSRRYKRALLGFSVAAYLFAAYKLHVKDIPYLEIPAPQGEAARHIVPMLLLMALAYHLISFVLYAWADVRKWHLEMSKENFAGARNLLFNLNDNLHHIRTDAQKILGLKVPEHLPKMDMLMARMDEAWALAKNAGTHYEKLLRASTTLSRTRLLTAWIWEFALPLMVSIPAIIYLALHISRDLLTRN